MENFDPRYLQLKKGIEKLSISEIQKILDYPEEMVYDGYNFDPYTKRY